MGASGRNWIEGSGHYQIRHINTSILKKLLDVSYLVIGNKVASLTNLHQCLQEHFICISYMALKGINTPSLYIDQENTEKRRTITKLSSLLSHHRSRKSNSSVDDGGPFPFTYDGR